METGSIQNMKNTIKIFGIITLVTVMGFSMMGCDSLPGAVGTLKIERIGGFNEMFVWVEGIVYDDDKNKAVNLIGVEGLSGKENDFTMVLKEILRGEAKVPLYVATDDAQVPADFTPYDGSHSNYEFSIVIFDVKDGKISKDDIKKRKNAVAFGSLSTLSDKPFSNGELTVIWQDITTQ
jgi:hypothetical protein